METRHVCSSKPPNTHLRNNDLSKKWTPVAIKRVCLQIDWIIYQRHVHRKGIPTAMLSYVYSSQSLRVIQFPLEPIRAGVQNRHSGRWRTCERYARGPCNRLAPTWGRSEDRQPASSGEWYIHEAFRTESTSTVCCEESCAIGASVPLDFVTCILCDLWLVLGMDDKPI